ncbi:hypothetical protein DM01DRAFT_1384899 [Hesseltinella vesiculosa]|uniref:Pyrroloquinoline quinone-dependent pyranose dehydrogenase beta-propeller domain-containing protein n=1 Tax=Hesseltinella vesiculosa TaxID=101127 RepID=A0A1X2GD30_9FUNG|nr:hypothetical protein DM01DRAFT_1384899 [Hesseltinella vesiculosa]
MQYKRSIFILALWFALFTLLVHGRPFGKKDKDEEEEEDDEKAEEKREKEEQRLEAAQLKEDQKVGGIRIGSTNMLVPDSAADLPMVLSHKEDQPLCKPDMYLEPAQALQLLEGFDAVVLSNSIEKPGKMIMDRVNHLLIMSGDESVYSMRMDRCGNVETKVILSTSSDQLHAASMSVKKKGGDEEMDDEDQEERPLYKLGHGLALDRDFLYISTNNRVFQFPYSDGQHSRLENGRVVLDNINPENDEARPDIAIDPFGQAYVPRSGDMPTVASDTNSELDSILEQEDALIKKFNFRSIPKEGFDYDTDGSVHAYGANTHGFMAFDTQARLWGMDQSFDVVQSADFAGEPIQSADELNLYEIPLARYGFPNCYTGLDMDDYYTQSSLRSGKGDLGSGVNRQKGHPSYKVADQDMNEYCKKADNNQLPSITLNPGLETAGLLFYKGVGCSMGNPSTMGTSVGMPCNWTDTPFLANRGPTGENTGHSVMRLPFDDLGHLPRPDKDNDILIQQVDPCTGYGCFTPSGLAFDGYGRLLIASEETNEILMINRVFSAMAAQMLTDSYLADQKGTISAAEYKEEEEEEEEEEE